MSQRNDLSRSLIPFDQHNALIAVIEMSHLDVTRHAELIIRRPAWPAADTI